MEKILCYNCYKTIEIDEIDNYHEYWEWNTCWIIECPHCKKINAISFSYSVDFDWREADKEDLEEFDL